MRSIPLILSATFAIFAQHPVHANATHCGQLVNAAIQELAAASTYYDIVQAMKPEVGATFDNKALDEIDTLVQLRNPEWKKMKIQAERLDTQVKSVRAKLIEAETYCRQVGQTGSANLVKARFDRFTLPGAGLEPRSKKLLASARCGEAAEGIDVLSLVIGRMYDQHGFSSEMFRNGIKYNMHKPDETAEVVKTACAGLPGIDNVILRLPTIEERILRPYQLFVRTPMTRVSPEELDLYKSQFVDYLVSEISWGHIDTMQVMLNHGQYKFDLSTGDASDGTTVFMAAAMSGNVELIRALGEFAKKNPGRGTLAVDKKDNYGNTALLYCVQSPRGKAEMIPVLLSEFKVDKSVRLPNGHTALSLARELKRNDMAAALE